ncbi:MAG: hypothetical protein ACKVHE_30780, partial [Planctomycetales bacterium]
RRLRLGEDETHTQRFRSLNAFPFVSFKQLRLFRYASRNIEKSVNVFNTMAAENVIAGPWAMP